MSGFTGKALVAVAALNVLAACDTYNRVFNIPPPPPCPRVSVLADASFLTRFREGKGRDLTDVIFSGGISGIESACTYDVDEDTGTGTLTVDLSLHGEVERGPASRQRRAVLPYFVSILDGSGRVLSKEVFQWPVEFPGNRIKLQVTDEPVSVEIPIKPGVRGAEFVLYTGFQLTAEELEFSRSRRANRR